MPSRALARLDEWLREAEAVLAEQHDDRTQQTEEAHDPSHEAPVDDAA